MITFVVIFGFIVSFAAGLTVGLEHHWTASAVANSTPSAHPPTTQRGFLLAALNLTPDQQEKMKAIWAEAPDHRHEQSDRHNQCRIDRDEAIVALMSPEQKTQYDQIQKTYREKIDAIDQEFRAEFQRKVDETMKILTPEQQAKYRELLARRQAFDHGPHDHGDRGFRETNRRGDDRATSQPRSQPSQTVAQ